MMEKISKHAFCVIGMPGSTDDGEGFVQRLWEKANSRFQEVAPLAARKEDGSLKGVRGIMTDMDFTYGPRRIRVRSDSKSSIHEDRTLTIGQ